MSSAFDEQPVSTKISDANRPTPKRSIAEPLVLVALVPLFFLQLGSAEIQPWDEALYAIRARACLEHGAWLDQSGFAVGDLYSAAHPPLAVWCIAVSYSAFGVSEWSTRLPSALAGVGLIVWLFFFLRRRVSFIAALAGIASLATATHFLSYARAGQLDMVQLFFTTGAFIFFMRHVESERTSDAVWSGMLLGLSLLAKIVVSLMAASFWFLFFIVTLRRRWKSLLIVVSLALIVAAPWYLFMASVHENFFQHLFSAVYTISASGYHPTAVRPFWYYFNQLFIALPMLPFAFVAMRSDPTVKPLGIIATFWCVGSLLILTLIATKMLHFTLHLLVPASIVIALGVQQLSALPTHRLAFFSGATTIAIAWSFSEDIRIAARSLSLAHLDAMTIWCVAIILIAGVAIALLAWKQKIRTDSTRTQIVVAASAMLLFFSALHTLVYVFPQNAQSGGKAVAEFLKNKPIRHLVIVHRATRYSEYQPQLAFYLDGWNLGWDSARTTAMVSWDERNISRVTSLMPTNHAAFILVIDRDRYNPPTPEESRIESSIRAHLTTIGGMGRKCGVYEVFAREE